MSPAAPDDVVRVSDGEQVRAALLSVGSELLLGDLVDTNAAWIARRLTELGVDLVHVVSVRDDVEEMATSLRWLSRRAHLIVVGGGLGPTADDLTREAIASVAGVALEEREELVAALQARFAELGRTMAEQNRRQARIPVGATAFPAVGTAPGFAITVTDPSPTRVMALPGVPWELRSMFTDHVVPEVVALAGSRVTITRSVHVAGRGESDVAEVVEPLLAGVDGVTLAFLAHDREIEVRLTVSAEDHRAAELASQPLVDRVMRALGRSVAAVDEESLEDVVVRLLIERNQTLALGESVTAGAVAARLGRVAGASAALVGGVVVYATAAKHDLLGVDEELLARAGPVSPEVTRAIAANVRLRAGTDWGIGVTGVAGPTTVGDLPVGTCVWALAHPDGRVEDHQRVIGGDRGQVIGRVGTAVLDLLRQRLLDA